jgi:potassium-transporting ATPase KdpC subunit
MLMAIRFTLLIFTICGLIYPLTVTVIAQRFFPQQANGSLLYNSKGDAIGSILIGQDFIKKSYFHPRPSINHYDGQNSGGSNLAVSSQKLMAQFTERANEYKKNNPTVHVTPQDAITASASGLDPDISVENALIQSNRIAQLRRCSVENLNRLIKKHAKSTLDGQHSFINVLELNLALDQQVPLKSIQSQL